MFRTDMGKGTLTGRVATIIGSLLVFSAIIMVIPGNGLAAETQDRLRETLGSNPFLNQVFSKNEEETVILIDILTSIVAAESGAVALPRTLGPHDPLTKERLDTLIAQNPLIKQAFQKDPGVTKAWLTRYARKYARENMHH